MNTNAGLKGLTVRRKTSLGRVVSESPGAFHVHWLDGSMLESQSEKTAAADLRHSGIELLTLTEGWRPMSDLIPHTTATARSRSLVEELSGILSDAILEAVSEKKKSAAKKKVAKSKKAAKQAPPKKGVNPFAVKDKNAKPAKKKAKAKAEPKFGTNPFAKKAPEKAPAKKKKAGGSDMAKLARTKRKAASGGGGGGKKGEKTGKGSGSGGSGKRNPFKTKHQLGPGPRHSTNAHTGKWKCTCNEPFKCICKSGDQTKVVHAVRGPKKQAYNHEYKQWRKNQNF